MSDEDYVDKHLKRLVEKGPDTLASLRAEVASKNEQFQQYARKMELDMNALAAENERLRAALGRARTVLGNMALENEGAIFNRWPIQHEPLRADARNLLPVIDAALEKEASA